MIFEERRAARFSTFGKNLDGTGSLNALYPIGLKPDGHGMITNVRWGLAADTAGLAPAMQVLDVDGRNFSVPASIPAICWNSSSLQTIDSRRRLWVTRISSDGINCGASGNNPGGCGGYLLLQLGIFGASARGTTQRVARCARARAGLEASSDLSRACAELGH